MDAADRPGPIGHHDDQWLAIATELHLAAAARGEEGRKGLYGALGSVIDLLGDEFIDGRAEREWEHDLGYVEALMVLADVMQEAGAFHLAASLLDDLLAAATDLKPLHRGRILAQRARIEWKLGRLDEAADRFEAIAIMGRRIRSPELQARAANGLGAVAQQRGNFPEVERQAAAAAKIARKHGYRAVERVARYGLMIVSAKNGRHGESLEESWRILELSRGHDDLEAEVLQNMGQLLLEAGHPAVARACFARVVERIRVPRIVLPALGGLAIASARSGAEATVEWAVRELWRAQRLSVGRYDVAMAMLEAAAALGVLHRDDEATRYARAAASLATTAGFHEVHLRAEELAHESSGPAEAARLDGPALQVIRHLQALEPERLPEQLAFDEALA